MTRGRVATEMSWHLLAPLLTVRPVARLLGRSTLASTLATVLLAVGAIWHAVAAIETARGPR